MYFIMAIDELFEIIHLLVIIIIIIIIDTSCVQY